jgi:hypothetical protein
MESSHCATAVFRPDQWVLKRRKRLVGKINRFKRVALRCEKTARNVSSIVALALVFIIVKSIHRP